LRSPEAMPMSIWAAAALCFLLIGRLLDESEGNVD
jgi:hypothetical protein